MGVHNPDENSEDGLMKGSFAITTIIILLILAILILLIGFGFINVNINWG